MTWKILLKIEWNYQHLLNGIELGFDLHNSSSVRKIPGNFAINSE